jgi:MFS family permease
MSGVVGSGIVSVIVDRYKNYGAVMRICFFMCLVATILLSILLKSDAMLLLCILFGATGFFGMPLLPVCLEASAELVYPVGEALPSGLLMLSGQIWGILLILAGNGLQSWQGRPQPAIYTMAGLLAIATLTIMFFRGKYKRYELEQQRHRALEEANRVDAVLS